MSAGAIFKFEEGERAYRRRAPRAECPYSEGSREEAEWLAGWDNEDALDAAERAQYREEYARDMEPYTRPHRDGDVAP